MARPDAAGRVDGSTYPREVAPPGSEPLDPPRQGRRQRLVSAIIGLVWDASIRVLRPRADDVIVVRTAGKLPPEDVRGLNLALRRAGHRGAVLVLPVDALVHAEPAKLHREDRGYRETATYGTDRAGTADGTRDDRGVHTGVPGIPDGGVAPHPESEDGEDDPCAS